MMHEQVTSFNSAEVLRRARDFFTERVPQYGMTVEREGPAYAVFRGQGGEELVIAVAPATAGTRVRASTLLFDQAIGRFFSTLPPATQTESAA
jgi:hypothetical protein